MARRLSALVIAIVCAATAAALGGSNAINNAAAFGWRGYADTDLQFSEFYGSNHTLSVRFMLQYPNAYTGPILSVDGSGAFFLAKAFNQSRLQVNLGGSLATARHAESGSGGRLVSPGAGPKQQFVHLLPEWQPGLSGLHGSGRFRSTDWYAAFRSTRKWRHGQRPRNPALRVRRRCRDFQEGTDRRRDHESRAESALDRRRNRFVRRLYVRCNHTRRRSPAAPVVETCELSHRHARCTVSRSSGVHRSRLRGSEQRDRCRLAATAVSAGGHAAAISGR